MTIPISLLATHLLGDFFLQTDWMATNKSKDWLALAVHVFVYTACFAWLMNPYFLQVTFITHFLTDAVTSRINAKLWVANKRHWFFCGIGCDQFIHYVTLALTYKYLIG